MNGPKVRLDGPVTLDWEAGSLVVDALRAACANASTTNSAQTALAALGLDAREIRIESIAGNLRATGAECFRGGDPGSEIANFAQFREAIVGYFKEEPELTQEALLRMSDVECGHCDFSHFEELRSLPDWPSVTCWDLSGCRNLETLPEGFNPKWCDLTGCTSLKLPESMTEEVVHGAFPDGGSAAELRDWMRERGLVTL